MSDEELIMWLENVGNFSIAPDSLKCPTSNFMQSVFMALMDDMQLNQDAMKLPSWGVAQCLQWPEHYETVIPNIIFFSYARQIADFAGIQDFSIFDLYEPKPKRTRKIIFHLVALWKHILVKYQKYEDMKSALAAECEDKDALQQKVIESEEKLNSLPAVNPEDYEEVLKQKANLDKQFADLNKEKEEIAREYQAVKTEIADRNNKLSELNIKIISQKERLEELSCGILKSPNRLASEVEELRLKLEEENNKMFELMKEIKESEQKKNSLQLAVEDIENILLKQQELLSLGHSLRSDAISLSELSKTVKMKSDEVTKMKADLEAITSEVNTLDQRIAQRKLQFKTEIDDLQKLHAVLDENIEKSVKSLKKAAEAAMMLQTEKDSLESDFEERMKKVANIHAGVLVSMSEILKSFDSFVQQNAEEVQETKTLLEKFISDCSNI